MANTRKKAEPLATETKPARKAPAKAASTAIIFILFLISVSS